MGYALRLHHQWEWAGGYIPLVIKIEKDETNANHEVIDGR